MRVFRKTHSASSFDFIARAVASAAVLAVVCLGACGPGDSGDGRPDCEASGPAACGPGDGATLIVDAGGTDSRADLARGPDPVDPDGPAPADPCLAAIARLGDLEIFAYEASRPDADAGRAGVDSSRACARSGVLPWAEVTLPEARSACAASGFALCAGADWLAACGGAGHRFFPYGAAHQAGLCNDHVSGSSVVEATGARSECETPEGVFDLSGNLAEMTDDAMRRGGSFRVNAVMYQPSYAQCDAQLRVFEGVASDEVGFRCCRRP